MTKPATLGRRTIDTDGTYRIVLRCPEHGDFESAPIPHGSLAESQLRRTEVRWLAADHARDYGCSRATRLFDQGVSLPEMDAGRVPPYRRPG